MLLWRFVDSLQHREDIPSSDPQNPNKQMNSFYLAKLSSLSQK